VKNPHPLRLTTGFRVVCFLLAGWISFQAYGVNTALIDRERDGSRSTAVHRIPLYDSEGEKISIDDALVLPFSTRTTCGDCHRYEKIEAGWHFSAIDEATGSEEPGEPWILTDEQTGTQIPVSTRGWKGTWKPAEIGLTPWKFIEAFGSHLAGGGLGERENDPPDIDSKWQLSGKLEINCLACHGGAPYQDQSEWAVQIERQNFAWAATAASGMASVRGSVASLPDTYDLYDGPDLDDPAVVPPSVEFNPALLDKMNKAFFDVDTKPSADRCYFCHSRKPAGEGAPQVWQLNEDVHLNSGLTCVDCHRNGLDHQMTRGREVGSELTCEGCHQEQGGTGGAAAPDAKHAGLPPIHFEKMTCTVCHSGILPGGKPTLIRTSRAHRLGTHTNVTPGEQGLPFILSPVFVQRENGKSEPCNVLWPSFWGTRAAGRLTPILPQTIAEEAGGILQARINDVTGTEFLLTKGKVQEALKALNRESVGDSRTVYVCGGRVYGLGGGGELEVSEHPAAQPYAWPVAHDVRPAAQSLGSGGCTDCHSTDAPFFFASIEIPSPLHDEQYAPLQMCGFQGQDETYNRLFGLSFLMRPVYKWFGFILAGLLAAILLLYGLLGLRKLCILAGRWK